MSKRYEREPTARGLTITDLNITDFATTVTGRPLAERKGYQKLIDLQAARGVDLGSSPSRFKDSRAGKGKRINTPALAAMTRNGAKQDMLDSLAWIHREMYRSDPLRLTNESMLDLGQAAESLPAYLLLRADSPIPLDQVPEAVSNVHKIGLGFRMLAEAKISKKLLVPVQKPQDVYKYANDLKLYEDGEDPKFQCAGPEPLQAEVAHALAFGQGGNPDNSILKNLFEPLEEIDLFAFSRVDGTFRRGVDGFREGVVSLASLTYNIPKMQETMNVYLQRDPSTAPLLTTADIVRFEEGAYVSLDGSMTQQAKAMIDAAYEQEFGRVETLQLKPFEHKNSRGKRGGRRPKGAMRKAADKKRDVNDSEPERPEDSPRSTSELAISGRRDVRAIVDQPETLVFGAGIEVLVNDVSPIHPADKQSSIIFVNGEGAGLEIDGQEYPDLGVGEEEPDLSDHRDDRDFY